MTWKEDSSWRPIETAPRDGSRVALLIPYTREKFSQFQCTDVGYWEPLGTYHKADIGMGIPQWGADAGGCFRFDGDDGSFDIQPTHWRPTDTGSVT